ncbi:MAG TPA: diaminopimelate decarboxylase [Patescibacteria group bacterium]
MKKSTPFTKSEIEKIVQKYPTPFHLYDEKAIRDNAKKLIKEFAWNKGFREFFAVKALPNPYILQVIKAEGFGADCSSLAELVLAEKVGLRGEKIMFTSNTTTVAEYKKARELGAIINLDDITHIDFLEKNVGLPELLSFRYNPGKLRKGGFFIGKPEEAKFGLTREQILKAYKLAKDKGVKRFGLHTMIASNELDPNYFVETAKMLFELVKELNRSLGINFKFINIGGGIGIPYKPKDKVFNINFLSNGIKKIYTDMKMSPLKIYMENGRVITGPYGYLVTRVIHKKDIYKKYLCVDSCMANLMRPGMYGSYHHVTVLGKENKPKIKVYDITGSLCENNDKFAIDRVLPNTEVGDILVIHDTGAHGHAMGFNYNGKLRSAELLLQEDGEVKLIRRAETLNDYFATLDFIEVTKKKLL